MVVQLIQRQRSGQRLVLSEVADMIGRVLQILVVLLVLQLVYQFWLVDELQLGFAGGVSLGVRRSFRGIEFCSQAPFFFWH